MTYRKLLYVFATLIILGLVAKLVYPRALPAEIISVHFGQFRNTLQLNGKIRSAPRTLITAYIDGHMNKIDLKPGDPVYPEQNITTISGEEERSIYSRTPGVVAKVFRSQAGPVKRDEPLFEVVKIESLELVLDPPPAAAAQLKAGMIVKIEDWGGDEPLTAIIKKMGRNSALAERREITARIVDPPTAVLEKLSDNFSVKCTVFTGTVYDSISVPLKALFQDGNRWAVYRVISDRARLTYVTVDGHDNGQARISMGLTKEDRVILSPSPAIKDGSRVQSLSEITR